MKSDGKPAENEPKRYYSRPRDESLQAYKDWIESIIRSLNLDIKDDTTEEEWETDWREFWKKVKERL